MSFGVENIPENLGSMGLEMWGAYILGVEQKYNAKIKAEKELLELEKIEAERQLELQKGDSEKFETLISDLKGLKTKYSFDSDLNKKKMQDVSILIDKIIKHIN